MSSTNSVTYDAIKANTIVAVTGIVTPSLVADQIATNSIILLNDTLVSTDDAIITTQTDVGGFTDILFGFAVPPGPGTFTPRVIFNGFDGLGTNCPITLPDFPTDTPAVAPIGVVSYNVAGDLCPLTLEGLATNDTFLNVLTVNLTTGPTFVCAVANSTDFINCLLANPTFITSLITALTTNPAFITAIENALLADATFITNLGNALLANPAFVTNLLTALTTAIGLGGPTVDTFLTTLATALAGNATAINTLLGAIAAAPGFAPAVVAALVGTTPTIAGLSFDNPPTVALPTVRVDVPGEQVEEFSLNQVLPVIPNGVGPAPANAAPVMIFQTLPNTAYNFRIAWVVKVPQPLIGPFVTPIGAASAGADRWLINNYATAVIPGPTVTAGDITQYEIQNAGGPLSLSLTAAPGLAPGSVVFYLNNNTVAVPAIPAGTTFAASVQYVRTPDVAVPPV